MKIKTAFGFAIILVSIIGSIQLVQAADRVNAGSSTTISAHNIIRKIINNSSLSYFIPTRTSAEWTAFLNNLPFSVSAQNADKKTVVFITPSTYNGNLGNRSGIDSKCKAVSGVSGDASFSNIHGLISVWDDDIQAMPNNYGYDKNKTIYWMNLSNKKTTKLADNWSDMLDGTIDNSGKTGTGYSGEVWAGSWTDGEGNSSAAACSYNPNRCSCGTSSGASTKWTVGSSSSYGGQGSLEKTNREWIANYCPSWSNCDCGDKARIMCIAEWSG